MKKFLFIATIFIFCIGLCCNKAIPDNDLWARLIAGQSIVDNYTILKQDFLSYTPTHAWYDHEWGASAIIYAAFKYFGDAGLILLKGILAALTVLFCYKAVAVRNKDINPCNIFYYLIMYLAAVKSMGNVVRCLMFTSFFFAVSLYILESARAGNKKKLFLLPLIMIFWSNIHGGCISLLGLLGIYTIGEFLNKSSYKEYIYCLLGCLASLFINPYGFEYVKFLFYAATMDRGYITEWISSFNPYFVHRYIFYKVYLIVFLIIPVIYFIKEKLNYTKIDKTKYLLFIIMAYLSIMHVRHQALFALTAGVFMYEEFYSVVNTVIYALRQKFKIENKEFIREFCLFKDVAIYSLALFIAFPLFISHKEIRISETVYPIYMIEFVKINDIKGNLFINFDWGSYAAYKLYPNNLIVMDGRYEEVYNPELLTTLYNFHKVRDNWDKIIKDYKTDVMILETKYPVYEKIKKSDDWKLVFANELYGVFVPSNTVRENYKYPPIEDEYYNSTKFNTDIFKINKKA